MQLVPSNNFPPSYSSGIDCIIKKDISIFIDKRHMNFI